MWSLSLKKIKDIKQKIIRCETNYVVVLTLKLISTEIH